MDDNLIGTRPEEIAYAKDLFGALATANLGKHLAAQVSINFAADLELLDLAARAGCVGVFVRFEGWHVETRLRWPGFPVLQASPGASRWQTRQQGTKRDGFTNPSGQAIVTFMVLLWPYSYGPGEDMNEQPDYESRS